MTFQTSVANFETDDGDKILYPFGPPIFQSEIDPKLTKELIEESATI